MWFDANCSYNAPVTQVRLYFMVLLQEYIYDLKKKVFYKYFWKQVSIIYNS